MRALLTVSLALFALLLCTERGEARRWNAGLELSVSHDRTSAGSLRLSGSGLEARLSGARKLARAPRFSIVTELVARSAGGVSLGGPDNLRLHPDTTLLFAQLAAGLRYQLRPRLQLEATAGPVLMALVTPRVFGASEIGAATSVAASRTLLGDRSSLAAVARLSAAAIPDRGQQTFVGVTMSLGLQGAFAW